MIQFTFLWKYDCCFPSWYCRVVRKWNVIIYVWTRLLYLCVSNLELFSCNSNYTSPNCDEINHINTRWGTQKKQNYIWSAFHNKDMKRLWHMSSRFIHRKLDYHTNIKACTKWPSNNNFRILMFSLFCCFHISFKIQVVFSLTSKRHKLCEFML